MRGSLLGFARRVDGWVDRHTTRRLLLILLMAVLIVALILGGYAVRLAGDVEAQSDAVEGIIDTREAAAAARLREAAATRQGDCVAENRQNQLAIANARAAGAAYRFEVLRCARYRATGEREYVRVEGPSVASPLTTVRGAQGLRGAEGRPGLPGRPGRSIRGPAGPAGPAGAAGPAGVAPSLAEVVAAVRLEVLAAVDRAVRDFLRQNPPPAGKDGRDGQPGAKGDKGDPGPQGPPGESTTVTVPAEPAAP